MCEKCELNNNIIVEKNRFLQRIESTFESHNSFKNLILDGSFSPYYGKKLSQEAQARQIPCYNVAEKGAFILEK